MRRLLTVDGLSEYLSLPKATIYTWVCQQKIPPRCVVRMGRALRFDVGEIDQWVNRKKKLSEAALVS